MIDGKWHVWAETPLGRQDSIFDLKCEEGGIMRGTVSNLAGDEVVELKKGRWDEEGNFSFRSQQVLGHLGKLGFNWEGKVDGDAISGIIKVVMGKSEYQGERVTE